MDILFFLLRILPWIISGQGIILAIAILSKRSYKSNLYLGIFIIMLSIHSLITELWGNPENNLPIEIYIVFSCMPFLYGPLIYRYVWHSLYREWKDPLRFNIHMIPVYINLLFYFILYLILGQSEFSEISSEAFMGDAPFYVMIIEWAKVVQGSVYTLGIIILLYRQRDALKRLASERQHKSWFIIFLTVFALNWILVIASAVFFWSGASRAELYDLFTGFQMVAFLIFIYTIVFFAIKFPVILEPKEIREEIRKKLNLPEGFVEEAVRRLDRAEVEGFYRDPEITLAILSKRLGLHPNALSYIINEEKGSGFRGYLNLLRVSDFIDKVNTDNSGQSYLQQSFDAGFSSKSTFLRAFRAVHGTTPQEFFIKS